MNDLTIDRTIEWYHIEDLLPEDHEEVIVCTNINRMFFGFYNSCEFLDDIEPYWMINGSFCYNVTHWAPILNLSPYEE